jgi:hypothetical protein
VVTPTIESRICVYGIKDKDGIVKCGIEQEHFASNIIRNKIFSAIDALPKTVSTPIIYM